MFVLVPRVTTVESQTVDQGIIEKKSTFPQKVIVNRHQIYHKQSENPGDLY